LTSSGSSFFLAKKQAKANYRKSIADNKKSATSTISNSLQNLLLDSDQINFWKIWHKKFGSKAKSATCIDGLADDTLIANKFADLFASTCRPNASHAANDGIEEAMFRERLANYKGDPLVLKDFITTEFISSAIKGLENGKAASSRLIDYTISKHIVSQQPVACRCRLQI